MLKKNNNLLIGKVVSDKMYKTVVVSIERRVKHCLYGKFLKKFTRCYVHDENNICKIGDLVSISETRPYSKTKKWVLVNIIKNV